MSANQTQIGGTHYTDMPIQPWDFIKYAARHQAKGGIEDLRKARHYLEKLIDVSEKAPDSRSHAIRGDGEKPVFWAPDVSPLTRRARFRTMAEAAKYVLENSWVQ